MTDLHELRTELQWCVENGHRGPRTEAALIWAVEVIDKLLASDEAKTDAALQ